MTIEKYKKPDRKPCGQSLVRKTVNDVNYINNYVTL
jgi:hypothetical protein